MMRIPASCIEDVKAVLLPIPWMVRGVERLIECLPRRNMMAHLIPVSDIEISKVSRGEFKSTGNRPAFKVIFEGKNIQAGWYYLEGAIVLHNGNRTASVQVFLQDGGCFGYSILIPSNKRGTVREIIWLPDGVSRLEWVPTSEHGYFCQRAFLLHHITPLESIARRIYRVLFESFRRRTILFEFRQGFNLKGPSDLQAAYQHAVSLRLRNSQGDRYNAYLSDEAEHRRCTESKLKSEFKLIHGRLLVSILMHVSSPASPSLLESVESMMAQSWCDLQFILVGRADPADLIMIEKRVQQRRAIKVFSYVIESDSAESLNKAIEASQSEFVLVVEQHAKLATHAVAMLVRELLMRPNAYLVYADHDRFDENRGRFDPHFKPDWNPDLLLSQDYIGYSAIFRRRRILEVGGFRTGFKGSELFDLVLRYTEGLSAESVRHVPEILFHGKQEANGASHRADTHLSQKRAVADRVRCQGGVVEDGLASGLFRVKFPLPSPQPLVSIIIPTRDKLSFLRACVSSVIGKTAYDNWELLVVDNGSQELATKAYLDELRKMEQVRVLEFNGEFNYSSMNNFAVGYARGEVLALLNNDVEIISESWLAEMVAHAVRPSVGAVGAKLLYSDGSVQHAGVILGIGGVAGHAFKYLEDGDHGYCNRANSVQNLSAVTGACLVVEKALYAKVGGLNEVDLKVAFNDVDFCLKLSALGFRNVYTPYAKLYHHESISRGQNDSPEKRAVFAREASYMKQKWGPWIERDPAYNPNLSLQREDFSMSTNVRR